ncbi:Ktr system potassium uptake protein A [Clostridium tepidiprofundi DSM 19306]|uniref:Ktr system potassium uptake protein A n=1 Tax=Clostridium tepidiprofundi DSM 19306 TaxID=1121338 RepID=A0A151B6G9_9CLOT|nr:TrkA family potassium uptake protein [Clostridium tepidiprofundi]KYH35496.1 Ktr system potassium uptake protein A [Clostridium tepidiprofundi DSM 19306]
MSKKQYVVIGLGRFGVSVAQTLFELGNDVLALDSSEEKVQNIADTVTHAVQADATDENSLRAIGIRNFDVAVVSIGEDIQASIMATLLLKEIGVKHVITKANNAMHAKVLRKIGADKVIFPEKDMGARVAHNLVSSNILEYIELSSDYSIAEFVSPASWSGKNLIELQLRGKYGINVVAIKRNNEIDVSPSADEEIESGDIIVAIGSIEDLNKLEHVIE